MNKPLRKALKTKASKNAVAKLIVSECFEDEISRRAFLKQFGYAGIGLLVSVPMFGCQGGSTQGGPGLDGDMNEYSSDGDLDSNEQEAMDEGEEEGIVPGRLALDGPNPVPVGTYDSWVITVAVGDRGLRAGDRLALAVEHGTDWGDEKDETGMFTNRFGGITVSAGSKAEFDVLGSYFAAAGNVVEIEVTNGSLKEGDTIQITIGDSETGSLLHAPSIAHEASIRVLENLDGEKTKGFIPLLLYREIDSPLLVKTLPLKPVGVSVLASSHAVPGDECSIVLRVEDKFGNICTEYEGVCRLYDDENDRLLAEVRFNAADAGLVHLSGVSFTAPGIYRLRCEVSDHAWISYGGPIRVSAEETPVYWGQMHGHSLVSDGLGSAEDYYEYARDASNLDFAALTDHGFLTEMDFVDPVFFRHYIDSDSWDRYAQVTRDFHDPNRFVTFLAYEWTSNRYSDKIVYFLHDDEVWQAYPKTPEELYSAYKDRAHEITVISHMMWATLNRRATDWDTCNTDLERIVEVASVHGVREYSGNPYWIEQDSWARVNASPMRGHMAADALLKGHRLGFTCGADCHQGFPGNAHPGRHPCRCQGLMAISAGSLKREALWASWQDREVYGSTGPRVLLDFSINGEKMGSEITLSSAEKPELKIEIASPVNVLKVEIIRDDPESPAHIVAIDPPTWKPGVLSWTDPVPLSGSHFYYVRITLEAEEYVWSSPIWVDLI